MTIQKITEYLTTLETILGQLPEESIDQLVDLLVVARDARKMIFAFGNGGSASTASHFACDLLKNTIRENAPRFKAIALNDNIPALSAYANDVGYEAVFSEPLRILAHPGDVAIAISGSGNSPNVLRAMEVARDMGLRTVGITGFQGGKLKDMVELSIVVPFDDMRIIEDAHLVICHAVHNRLLHV